MKPYGVWFPLDPGPGASIGGMCACRCSGSTAVKYGSMRENVLNVKGVMSDGSVLYIRALFIIIIIIIIIDDLIVYYFLLCRCLKLDREPVKALVCNYFIFAILFKKIKMV